MKKSFLPNSTAIREVIYLTNSGQLTVYFHNGDIHIYHGVPSGIFDEFKKAKSAGAYFNAYIRNIY